MARKYLPLSAPPQFSRFLRPGNRLPLPLLSPLPSPLFLFLPLVLAGLLAVLAFPVYAQVDATSPTISSIAITSDTGDEDSILDDDGVYGIGDRIELTVTFSEEVSVTGSPQLEMEIGNTTKAAHYESVDGSAVVFSYTVLEGDEDNDGVSIGTSKLTLNGGIIQDATDNDADLTHDPLPSQDGHLVDGIRPTITKVNFPATSDNGIDGIRTIGEKISLRARFSEPVNVKGNPQLMLDLEGTTRLADFEGGFAECFVFICMESFSPNGLLTLMFAYEVVRGDLDPDGVSVGANSVILNGGTIKDEAGNDAVLSHEEVPADSDHKVEGVPPIVSSIAITSDPGEDNTYHIYDRIEFTVTFSDTVRIHQRLHEEPSGRTYRVPPELELNIGGVARAAEYQRHTGAEAVFTYSVQAGDTDEDGISIDADKLTLSGGKITDNHNDADLRHESVGDNEDHKVCALSHCDASLKNLTLSDILAGYDPRDTRALSGLELLAFLSGTPRFQPSKATYSLKVENDLDETILWTEANNPEATYVIKVNGVLHTEEVIPLADGENTITIDVTAEDGTNSRTYTFVIDREANSAPSGAPNITGSHIVGETLTANISGISDEDGLDNVSFEYQWLRHDGTSFQNIPEATGSTYTLTEADEGKTVKVRVFFTDDEGHQGSLTSRATEVIRPAGILSITLLNASTQAVLKTLMGGSGVNLEDPATGSYAIRVEVDPDVTVGSLNFELTGPKDSSRMDNSAPYSLYGDGEDGFVGEPLPAGIYELKVTAYSEADQGGVELETRVISFTVNSRAIGAPTVTGNLIVGQKLTAGTSEISDQDRLDNASFEYQWLRNNGTTDMEIEEGKSGVYTLTQADEGQNIKVMVTFTDDAGFEESLTSAATGAVEPEGGTLRIIGRALSGETLTADTTGIFDEDGLENATFQYTWFLDFLAYGVLTHPNQPRLVQLHSSSVSEPHYTIPHNHWMIWMLPGNGIVVQVTFADDAGNQEVRTSAPTEPVGTILPVIDGSYPPGVGLEMRAETGRRLLEEYNLTNPNRTYQWIRNDGSADSYIPGANGSRYLPTTDDVCKTIKVRVTYTDDVGSEVVLTSVATEPVLPIGGWGATVSSRDHCSTVHGTNNEAAGYPIIGGTAQVGQTLTADISGIADEDGLNNATFSYQWVRNDGTADTHIADATGVAYTLVSDDEGKTIKVEVSFTDEAGNEEMRTSEPTNPVAAAVVAAALPTKPLNLTVTRGSQIEELDASWQTPASDGGSDITGYRVQWKEAADSWDTPEDVSEETVTGTTHTIHGLTEGVEYAVRVMATNQVGEGPASAEKTAVLRDIRAPEVVTFGVDGANLRVVYDEALDEGSAPPADAFDVRVACSCDDMTWLDEEAKRAVNLVSVDGDTVMLTLASPATADDYVVVSYNPPSDEASPRVQDVAGNAAAAIKRTQIINDTEEVSEDEAPAQNTSATGVPTITGTLQVGETLTADTTGIADEDGLTNAVFSYQWMADDTNIQGATGSGYTLTSAEQGKAITVTVSFTDAEGNPETLTSDPTGEVAAKPNTQATGQPTISGTVRVGETLTADVTGIADEDGLDNVTFSYQWMADDANIQDATGSSYTLPEDDEGRAIKVTVSFTDAEGNPETLTSDPTGEVAPAPAQNIQATGVPTISGTLQVGETLTADTTGITDADGLTTVSYSYQWMADDTNIQDATDLTYTLTEDDEGKAITVRVSFTDDANNEESLTSEPTGPVVPDPGPLIVFKVVDTSSNPDTVLGTLEDGGSLKLANPASGSYGIRVDTDSGHDDHGDIHKVELDLTGAKTRNKEEGVPPYSLYGDEGEGNLTGENLPAGAYELKATAYDDDGDVLGTLKVSFTVTAGQPAQQPTVVPNTSATGQPTISGTARVGETLTADVTGIADEDGLDNVVFSYQWMADDTNIQDATDLTYALTEDDEGKAITVRVSFTDDANNEESLTSEPTGPVAPDPGPLTVFKVVDTSSNPDTVLGTLEDGGALTLGNPTGGEYGIRVDTDSTHDDHGDIHKVELDLTGAKTGGKEEWVPPYSLYGDEGEGNLTGENLPAGAYELKATAYDADGDVLGTLKVSFTVTEGQPAQQPTVVPNTSATGVPTIDGTAQVGQTLTAETSGIADEDGLTNVVFSYQWMADDTNIQDATGSTYTLTEGDEGKAITVTVSFTDAEGNPETLTSDPTREVAAKPNTQATGQPTISGTVRVGETLTADVTGIADEDGLDNVTFSYQWMADDANKQDATGSSYTLVSDDESRTITVTVSFTDAEGNPETLTSDPTGEVAAAPAQNIQATGVPTITGTLQVGETLTADTTGIADADGLTTVSYSYQWMADDTNIQGATGATYTLAEDDEGKAITVRVYFTDDAGNVESRPSAPTDAVAAPPAQNSSATGAPSISGTAQVGQTLTADTSGIADEDGLTNAVFSYQWVADDEDIAGATGSSYTLTEGDEGKAITVTVSFTDAEGNPETMTSDPTGEVAAKPNTQATGAPAISGMARVGATLTADVTEIADEDGLDSATFSYQWVRSDGGADDQHRRMLPAPATPSPGTTRVQDRQGDGELH